MIKRYKSIFQKAMLLLFFSLSIVKPSYGELSLESVYPTLGLWGQPLNVTLSGTEFDTDTRVSMSLDSGNRRFVIGTIDTPSYAHDIVIRENMAYIADDASGLQVIDISNATNPQIIQTENTPGLAKGIVLSGSYAYIADGDHGLQVIDISNPGNPQIIGNGVDTPGDAQFVDVSGNRAYIADGPGGLQIIDISNPASPQIIGSKDIGFEAHCVQVKNNIAYVTASGPHSTGAVLRLIDITNPQDYPVLGSVTIPGIFAYGVTVVDDTAYVAAWKYNGLQVIDVSNPSNPWIKGWIKTDGRAHAVDVVDDIAYVANDLAGLGVIDVSNSGDLQVLGTIDTQAQAGSVKVIGNLAYIAGGEGGLQIIDITAPRIQQVIGWVSTPGIAQFFEISDNKAFMGDGEKGLQVIDLNDKENPELIGNVELEHQTRHVDVVGNLAYAADTRGGIQVIDISDPRNPEAIGEYIPSGDAWTRYVTVSEAHDIAFLANGERLILVDISTPSSPSLIKEVPGFEWLDGRIAINGNYAYVPDRSGNTMKVVDFSTPASAFVVKTIDLPHKYDGDGPRYIMIIGNKTYVANGKHGLCILDTTTPANPVFNPSWSLELFDKDSKFVTVVGDIAYVPDGEAIHLVDISDPANMVVIGSLDTVGGPVCVSVSGDKAFVSDFGNGLIVVPLPVEIKPV
ncbi:hypothetical protein ACFL2E_12440, partial [Thermodesulfobacteriota bacterium]